jgi:apolipoprotein N-acyltransferase
VASALLWACSFPPLGWWPLAWFALAPLFVRLAALSPAKAALLAGGWAALGTLAVAWWFPATVSGFFQASASAGLLGLAGLAAFAALFYAPFGAWLGASARRGRATPLAVGAVFTLVEFARAHFWIANPFALAAAAQTAGPWLQVVDVVGSFGLGWLVASTNAVLAGFWSPALAGLAPRRQRLGVGACLLAGLAYGIWHGAASPASSREGTRVAVVETLPPSHDPGNGAPRLERQLALSREALAQGARLVLWPEYAVHFYPREDTAERERLLAATADAPLEIAFGAPHYRVGEEGLRYLTSVFLVRDGQVVGRSDKTQLVPFAEWAPLGPRWAAPGARYSAGPGRVLETRALGLGSLICSEAFFPAVARGLVRDGADLLSNPSNDAWYGHPAGAAHQLQAARLRAVENRRPLVRPAAGGDSAWIDERGRVTELLPGRGEGMAVVHFTRREGRTLYSRLGDWVLWLALPAAALPWLRARPKLPFRRRSR